MNSEQIKHYKNSFESLTRLAHKLNYKGLR
jgi:hypothetical protein